MLTSELRALDHNLDRMIDDAIASNSLRAGDRARAMSQSAMQAFADREPADAQEAAARLRYVIETTNGSTESLECIRDTFERSIADLERGIVTGNRLAALRFMCLAAEIEAGADSIFTAALRSTYRGLCRPRLV